MYIAVGLRCTGVETIFAVGVHVASRSKVGILILSHAECAVEARCARGTTAPYPRPLLLLFQLLAFIAHTTCHCRPRSQYRLCVQSALVRSMRGGHDGHHDEARPKQASQAAMYDAKLDVAYRDQCAALLIPLNK